MRPTEYDPAFCDVVIAQGKLGKSIVQMALACGVCRNTLKGWAAEHPEFLTAFTLAKEYSLQWWESIAQTHMIEEPGAAKINQGVWSRSMAARFPDEYTEKKQTELTGANGGPIKGLNVSFVDSASE
jgi:hypothetical protein